MNRCGWDRGMFGCMGERRLGLRCVCRDRIPMRLVFCWRTLTVTRVYSRSRAYRKWGFENFRGRRFLNLGPIQFGWGVAR